MPPSSTRVNEEAFYQGQKNTPQLKIGKQFLLNGKNKMTTQLRSRLDPRRLGSFCICPQISNKGFQLLSFDHSPPWPPVFGARPGPGWLNDFSVLFGAEAKKIPSTLQEVPGIVGHQRLGAGQSQRKFAAE